MVPRRCTKLDIGASENFRGSMTTDEQGFAISHAHEMLATGFPRNAAGGLEITHRQYCSVEIQTKKSRPKAAFSFDITTGSRPAGY
jgi:hypothetical protein